MIMSATISLVVSAVSAFLVPPQTLKNNYHANVHHFLPGISRLAENRLRLEAEQKIAIVGKIILDKYGPPDDQNDGVTTIGGGGPQAAWGASASLVVREYLRAAEKGEEFDKESILLSSSNKQHQVTFLGPIGLKNWTPQMTEQLSQLLPMVEVVLISSDDHITPTINIWHDENENVKWVPVNGSFETVGADGLWQNRPSAQDILDAVVRHDCDGCDIILHAIIESGSKPTGQGLDALPFFDDMLMSRVSVAGIEPIVFPDEASGKVTCEDSHAVSSTLNKIRQSFMCARGSDREEENDGNTLFVITPDRPCYEGMASHTNFVSISEGNNGNESFDMIIRDGGNGCFTNAWKMQAATLRTIDGTPVNPTGAGNAFSAAYVVCRGSGSSPQEAASIATAVGAAVCEYEHLPPWSFEVIERIAKAVCEVNEQMSSVTIC